MGRRSGGSDEDNAIGAADPAPPYRRPVSPPHGQGRTWTGGGGGQYPRMENGGTGLEERWPRILFAKFISLKVLSQILAKCPTRYKL